MYQDPLRPTPHPGREASPLPPGDAVPSKGGEDHIPSSALDLEKLLDTLQARPEQGGEAHSGPAALTDGAEADRLRRLLSRYRKLLTPQEKTLALAKESAIRELLRARSLCFSEGDFGNRHFFSISSMGTRSRPFSLAIDVDEKRCLVHFTAKLPFSCPREMLPAVVWYLSEANPLCRQFYTWHYDPEGRSIAARQTVPYWDPALDEAVLSRLLDGAVHRVSRSFDILEWLSTGLFSNEPEEEVLETCQRLLDQLEHSDAPSHRRRLIRLRLALEPWI